MVEPSFFMIDFLALVVLFVLLMLCLVFCLKCIPLFGGIFGFVAFVYGLSQVGNRGVPLVLSLVVALVGLLCVVVNVVSYRRA